MTDSTALTERNLIQVRLRFLDLIKSFFQDEPDAEKISRWRGFFAAISSEQINPVLDAAVNQLTQCLREKELQDIKNEYYALFIDPYSEHPLHLQATWYLDGRSFGPTLVKFRALLKQAGLIKQTHFADSEDSLPVLLDTLISLIEEEKSGGDTCPLQNQLVEDFLHPVANALTTAVQQNPQADFYQHCIIFLQEYTVLEKELVGHS
jgi:TorA maturation chaperone TorD